MPGVHPHSARNASAAPPSRARPRRVVMAAARLTLTNRARYSGEPRRVGFHEVQHRCLVAMLVKRAADDRRRVYGLDRRARCAELSTSSTSTPRALAAAAMNSAILRVCPSDVPYATNSDFIIRSAHLASDGKSMTNGCCRSAYDQAASIKGSPGPAGGVPACGGSRAPKPIASMRRRRVIRRFRRVAPICAAVPSRGRRVGPRRRGKRGTGVRRADAMWRRSCPRTPRISRCHRLPT